MKCLLGTLLLAALAVSARQSQTIFSDRPDSYGQDAQQQLALEHYTDLFSNQEASKEGLPDRQNPFLSVFREQFSAKTSDDSEVFYHRFRQLALQDPSKISSFTVTKDPSFNLLGFANANRDILQVRPIEDGTENTISRTVFMHPLRKRDGGGGIGKSIDFAGWEVSWRGMRFEIWQASWVKDYQQFTQYHIIGRNPSSSFPIDLAQPFSIKTANSSRIVSTIATGPDAADLLILEVGAWNSVVRDAILVFDQGYWSEDRLLYQGILGADWKDVILSESLKRSVRNEYTSFFSAETIYKNLGVAWKRGVIFLGPPGNGKTISVKAMMRDLVLGLDVGEEKKTVLYVRSFHTYMGDEYGIKQIFRRARREAPCLLVFEDVDSLITDMNRSFFLNEVDGLEDNDGLLMLATTNHFEKLDPALSNRPSRFDRKYTFPDPVVAERRQYAVYWQKKLASNKEIKFPDSLLDDFAKKTGGFSFAYMKEAFVSALLTLAGNEEHKKKEFPIVLMQQVKALRAELEKSS